MSVLGCWREKGERRTVVAAELEQHFAKAGLHALADDPANALAPGERN